MFGAEGDCLLGVGTDRVTVLRVAGARTPHRLPTLVHTLAMPTLARKDVIKPAEALLELRNPLLLSRPLSTAHLHPLKKERAKTDADQDDAANDLCTVTQQLTQTPANGEGEHTARSRRAADDE